MPPPPLHRTGRRSVHVVLVLLLLLAGAARAEPYSRVFVFGDSYTDTGNWVRVSNGPVWVEHLGTRLGMPEVGLASRLGGDNYAVSAAKAAGSRDIDLGAQLDRYEAAEPVGDPDALYLLFIGWNDLALGTDRSDATAGAVVSAVDRLVQHGARRVVVLDVPNKPLTPRFLAAPVADRAVLTADVLRVNLDWLVEAPRRDAWLEVVDVFALTTQVWQDPQRFGFEDATGHCSYDPVCDGFVWWDDIHPTTAFHDVIARRVLARLLGVREDEVDDLSPADIEALLAAAAGPAPEPPGCGGNGFGGVLGACPDVEWPDLPESDPDDDDQDDDEGDDESVGSSPPWTLP